MSTNGTLSMRGLVTQARRVVIKVGTNVLLQEAGGVALGVLYGLAESVARIQKSGREVVLVSSGAVGIGAERLGMSSAGMSAVCAAAGQSALISLYNDAFSKAGIHAAQILLTDDDFADDHRSDALRATLTKLLDLSIIPVINENDAVQWGLPEGFQQRTRVFGDNDELAALIAKSIGAELLVVLTDVDGLYTEHPAGRDAALIGQLIGITDQVIKKAGNGNGRGRGGMRSKLKAIGKAVEDGDLVAIIANGRRPHVLDQILSGAEIGTLIAAGGSHD